MVTSALVNVVILALFCSESIAQTSLGEIEDTPHLKKCGRSNVIITNGKEAHVGTFPWHAGLYYRTLSGDTETWEQKCGGSLITDQFILTAAHCVYGRQEADVRVALGKHFRSWDHYEYGEQKRNVSQITYPAEFNMKTLFFDVALLLLDENIKLGELIMPVCTGLLDSSYLRNKSLFVVGWEQKQNERNGSSSEIQIYNDVIFLPTSACQRFVSAFFSLDEKLCTMKNNSDESAVQRGNSGGGLTVERGGLHYIVGVSSAKISEDGKSVTLFTNITWPINLSWIEKEVKSYDNKFDWSGDDDATNPRSRRSLDRGRFII